MYWLQKLFPLSTLTLVLAAGLSAEAQDNFDHSLWSHQGHDSGTDYYLSDQDAFASEVRFDTLTDTSRYCPFDRSAEDYACPNDLNQGSSILPDDQHQPPRVIELTRSDSRFGRRYEPLPVGQLEAGADNIFDTIRFELRSSRDYEQLISTAWELCRSVRCFERMKYSTGSDFQTEEVTGEVEYALQLLRQSLRRTGSTRTIDRAVASFRETLSAGYARPGSYSSQPTGYQPERNRSDLRSQNWLETPRLNSRFPSTSPRQRPDSHPRDHSSHDQAIDHGHAHSQDHSSHGHSSHDHSSHGDTHGHSSHDDSAFGDDDEPSEDSVPSPPMEEPEFLQPTST